MFFFISDLNSKDVKMISSINFLFLISLAVTTWIILCYFKQIELQREEQMTVEIHMDNAFEDNLKPNACLENYDIYLNFLGVFACIYALAKVASVAESYVAQQVHTRFKQAKLFSSRHLEPTTIDEYRMQHQRFTLQIEYLEKANANLELKLKQLEQTHFMLREKGLRNGAAPNSVGITQRNGINSHHQAFNCKPFTHAMAQTCICARRISAVGSRVLEGVVYDAIESVGGRRVDGGIGDAVGDSVACGGLAGFRNVIIQDRHFQLTQQVYVNDGNVKLEFQDFNQEGGNITQVWQKYLEMQKYAIQKPTSPATPAEVANTVPLVVSTEELQAIKGTNDQKRGRRQPQRTHPTSTPTAITTTTTTTTTTSIRRLRSYYITHAHTHIPQTTLTLPIKIYYTNLLVCLLCRYL